LAGGLISGLARQTDFCTEHRNGRDVDAFETFITRQFEEPGQQAIDKLLACRPMTPKDWCKITRFVVAQDLRTPQDCAPTSTDSQVLSVHVPVDARRCATGRRRFGRRDPAAVRQDYAPG
jgi:hypothetical protein